jgi:hypothetical protein
VDPLQRFGGGNRAALAALWRCCNWPADCRRKKPAPALAETGDQLMIQRSVHAGQLLLLQASAVTADSFSRFKSVGRSYVFFIESPLPPDSRARMPPGNVRCQAEARRQPAGANGQVANQPITIAVWSLEQAIPTGGLDQAWY